MARKRQAIRVLKGVYHAGLGEQRLSMPPLVLALLVGASTLPSSAALQPWPGRLVYFKRARVLVENVASLSRQRVIDSSRRGTKRPFKRWRFLAIAKHGANVVKRFLALSMGMMIVGAAAAMAATENDGHHSRQQRYRDRLVPAECVRYPKQ